MENILHRMISDAVESVDTYVNNGSTWLIFTEEKRWVIELTKDGTLWYNYGFFKNIFSYLSTDVVENQHYITKWVEDNIINKKKPVKNGVKDTSYVNPYFNQNVEDTIQNGVKRTGNIINGWTKSAEDTIQNGVKEIGYKKTPDESFTNHIIQNGVKETKSDDGYVNYFKQQYKAETTVQNGVKHTEMGDAFKGLEAERTIQIGVKNTVPMGKDEDSIVSNDFGMNQAIENGVKHTISNQTKRTYYVDDTIQNGVKQTSFVTYGLGTTVEDIIQNGVKKTKMEEHHRLREVVQTVNNGIKEVQPLPAQDGNRDWGLYYKNREDRTKPHTKYVEEVISEGNKIHDI